MLEDQIKIMIKSIDNLSELSSSADKYKAIKTVLNSINFQFIDNVLIVDCRTNPDTFVEFLKDHNGFNLYSSEKAEYVLGYGDKDKFSTICSVTGTGDLRAESNYLESLNSGIKMYKQHLERFLKDAALDPKFDGGGVTHKPAFIAICNYGYSLHAFANQYVIT